MVRPTVSPIQARVLGAVLGVTGFAFASVSGLAAGHASAATKISDNKVWVTSDGSDKGPPAGDFVRVLDCTDVDVWGNDLHNKSGDFTIFFDDHNGKDRKIEEMNWKFDQGSKDDAQVIATINAKDLIKELKDKGFDAQDNGWHMDLQFSDPSRQVEFILSNDCSSDHTSGGGSSTPTPVQQEQAPPPVVKGTTTQAPKAAAVVPQTGADAPFLSGMLLMSAGGTFLGFARRLRRRSGR